MISPNPVVAYEKAFREAVTGAFRQMGINRGPVIEHPRSGEADLCLVTFPLVKETGTAPGELTEKILDLMGVDPRWSLSTSGGYLNCRFDRGRLSVEAGAYLWKRKEHPGEGERKRQRIIVEHTSANPNGPFHVGRARNPIIGDTLVRLLRLAGYDTEAQYWVNDMGKQVMVLVWGMKNIPESDLPRPGRDKIDHRLVRFYQAANSRMERDPAVGEEVNSMLGNYEEAVRDGDLDRVISSPGRNAITASDVREACRVVLEGMIESLARMGVSIDRFVYESKVVEDQSLWDVISGLEKSPLCREEEGARYLDLSELIKGGDDDHYRRRFVFTRSDGSALYTTRDLAYHKWKLSECDRAINVLGEDHRYQALMLDLALGELGMEKRPEVLFYAFVSLPGGKMSTRRNRVVFLDDLLDEAVDRAREEVRKRRDDLSERDLEEISETVGIGALRFNVIKVQPEKRMVFRWEEALNFEGSSAPFVQYSHARACSIIRNFGSEPVGNPDWSLLVEPSEKELVMVLSRFPPVIEDAAARRKMHLVPLYLVELASSFNDFYRDCPVLSEKDEGRMLSRLALVVLTRNTLRAGLEVLGIKAPERM